VLTTHRGPRCLRKNCENIRRRLAGTADHQLQLQQTNRFARKAHLLAEQKTKWITKTAKWNIHSGSFGEKCGAAGAPREYKRRISCDMRATNCATALKHLLILAKMLAKIPRKTADKPSEVRGDDSLLGTTCCWALINYHSGFFEDRIRRWRREASFRCLTQLHRLLLAHVPSRIRARIGLHNRTRFHGFFFRRHIHTAKQRLTACVAITYFRTGLSSHNTAPGV